MHLEMFNPIQSHSATSIWYGVIHQYKQGKTLYCSLKRAGAPNCFLQRPRAGVCWAIYLLYQAVLWGSSVLAESLGRRFISIAHLRLKPPFREWISHGSSVGQQTSATRTLSYCIKQTLSIKVIDIVLYWIIYLTKLSRIFYSMVNLSMVQNSRGQ